MLMTLANSHECGPEKCRVIKFILTDGDKWLFGMLKNPELNKVDQRTHRNCYFTILDNTSLTQIEDVIKLLAAWVSNSSIFHFVVLSIPPDGRSRRHFVQIFPAK